VRGLERFAKHEGRIFSTPGLALAVQGEGQHGVSERKQYGNVAVWVSLS
jgi:hypothetical protein